MKKAVRSCVTYLYPEEGIGHRAVSIAEMVDLAALINNSAKLACGGSSIACEISVAAHLWPAEADKDGLCEVLKSLITNAMENMPDSRKIWIRAENISIGSGFALPIKEGKYIKIRIEKRPHRKSHQTAFPPNACEEENQVKVLGLAECCSIIQEHGGLIFSESRAGTKAGTTIYLPASDKENAVKVPEAYGKTKVLIMDDEEIIRVVSSNMLKFMGYDVEVAGNGDEAVALFRSEKNMGRPFDAVILDLTVRGGMGGAETMKRLLAMDPEINAIVSSGYTQDPVMADFKEYGFKAVLPKPYKMAELDEVLKSVVQKPQF